MPVEIEIALATEIPILIPVKEPGPRDTKIRPISLNSTSASYNQLT